MKTFIFYLAIAASVCGLAISLGSLFGLIVDTKIATASFLAAMFAVSNAAIAYSVYMIQQNKDIGHKTYPASLVSLLLVILMIYRWWSL